jgi:hypothetical protein
VGIMGFIYISFCITEIFETFQLEIAGFDYQSISLYEHEV